MEVNLSSEVVSMESAKNLVIVGAGMFAREVSWLVRDINQAQPGTWDMVGFWEHGTERIGQLVHGIPIVDPRALEQYLPDLYAVAAIGDPAVRERAALEAERFGCRFATLVHPSVYYDRHTVEINRGSIVCAGNILTVDIVVGSHVIINLDCTVGHDSVIEDYVTISPGCHLAGHTTIRRSALLGSGVVTAEGCVIGAGSIIGAGAAVVRDIPAGVTALGIPAKPRGE